MRQGGSYIAKKGQPPKKVAGTDDHPDGNRARHADGKPMDASTAPATPAKTEKE